MTIKKAAVRSHDSMTALTVLENKASFPKLAGRAKGAGGRELPTRAVRPPDGWVETPGLRRDPPRLLVSFYDHQILVTLVTPFLGSGLWADVKANLRQNSTIHLKEGLPVWPHQLLPHLTRAPQRRDPTWTRPETEI